MGPMKDPEEKRPRCLRVSLRWIVCGTALALSVVQVVSYVDKYLGIPTSTKYRVQQMKELELPQIVICTDRDPSILSDLNVFNGDADGMDIDNNRAFNRSEGLMGVLRNCTRKASDLFRKIELRDEDTNLTVLQTMDPMDISTPSIGEWTGAALQMHPRCKEQPCVCHAFMPNRTLGKGFNENIQITLSGTTKAQGKGQRWKTPPEYSIFFLEKMEKVTDFEGIPFKFEFVEFDSRQTYVNVKLQPKIVKRVSTPRFPCTDDPYYTFVKCMEGCFLSQMKVNCSGPWMNTRKPTCSNAKDYEGFYQEYRSFVRMKTSEYKKLGCKCPRKCQLTQFRPVMERMSEDKKPLPVMYVKIFFPATEVEVLEEVPAYDMNEMLGEMGGSLGLLLGLSLVSLFQLAETCCDKARLRKE